MDLEVLSMVIILFFIMMTVLSFVMSLFCWIEVKAMQKSTHSIQYVPANSDFEKVSKELEEKFNKDIFEAV
jgi:uncharacterized protein YcgL (UPF0745 family)